MPALEEFGDIVRRNEPLAPYTYLKLGGPAEYLVQPRSREELSAVVRYCAQQRLPLRVLGGGCNILVRDEGVRGVVLRLNEPAFTSVAVEDRRVRADVVVLAVDEQQRRALAHPGLLAVAAALDDREVVGGEQVLPRIPVHEYLTLLRTRPRGPRARWRSRSRPGSWSRARSRRAPAVRAGTRPRTSPGPDGSGRALQPGG